MTDRKTLFFGELQLMRWSESSTNGATVTFWVHPEDLESFKALKARAGKHAGQRIGVVMVEIGDDEAVVEQPAPAPAPAPRRYPAPHVGALGMLAVRWCKDPAFQGWAADRNGVTEYDEGQCKDFILSECGVYDKYGVQGASRKHLDSDPECAQRFQDHIRRPFMEWRESTP